MEVDYRVPFCRYIGGLTPDATEADLREAFQAQGEVTSVRIIEARRCAFVTFADRAPAEKAVDELSNRLIIRGIRAKVMWGRPQGHRPDGTVPASMLPPQVRVSWVC